MVKIMRHLKMAERTGKMTGNSIYILGIMETKHNFFKKR